MSRKSGSVTSLYQGAELEKVRLHNLIICRMHDREILDNLDPWKA